jgi:hypothetical protein
MGGHLYLKDLYIIVWSSKLKFSYFEIVFLGRLSSFEVFEHFGS